jgi:hypothetical protein
MDWILALALGTFGLIIAFLLWNWLSTKRHHESGGTASGIGGPSDPLSGNSEGMRDPGEMRAALDTAASSTETKPSLH